MATATPTRRTFNRAETDRRVRHPLQALRGYIRMYVLIEGGLIALIYLALWFWIGLALDYGSFKLFGGWDWIQELQGITEESQTTDIVVRGVLLGILVAGLLAVVTVKVLLRLMREFRDTSLALVLERRFPKELGDRLITAVEMADPKLAVKYGFSSALIDQTINDAADRVEKVPVRQVFNWGRLRRLGLLVLGLTVGMYILVAGLSMGIAAIGGHSASPVDTMWRSYHTAAIWGERNLLLMNSYWPRQAHLELVRFQDTPAHRGEMRIGRDDQRPDLQARAYQWVVADSDLKKAPGGWRPLKWQDLPALLGPELPERVNIPPNWGGWVIDLEDLDKNIPNGVLPARWQGQTSGAIRQDMTRPEVQARLDQASAHQALDDLLDWNAWTLDKIAIQLQNGNVRRTLRRENPQALEALEAVLARISEMGTSASWERQIRQLAIPTGDEDFPIELTYWGKNTRRNDPPDTNRNKDNTFYFPLSDLKESVRFTVRAADFATPMQNITLVPPPTIASLSMDKEEPAYIYYRLQGLDQTPLRGKKQIFKDVQAGVMGDVSTIHVPIGTNLTLTAKADRPVKKGIRMQKPAVSEERGAILPKSEVVLQEDGQTFVTRFNNIKKTIEFEFEFNDYDNVKGKRRILIRPIDDRAPEVFDVEMLWTPRKPRFKAEPGKGNQGAPIDGFLITPDALLPFKGTLRDDYGLTDARWLYEVEPVQVELIGKAEKDKHAGRVLSSNARMRLVVAGLQFVPGMPGMGMAVPSAWLVPVNLLAIDLAQPKRISEEGFKQLERFMIRLEERSGDEVTMNQLLEQLKQKPGGRPLFKEHFLKDEDGFDVKKYLPKLKVIDPTKEAQLHYQIRLSVTATDNNVETGPSTGKNKAPFTFLVVSENELLSQIFIEEENLRERLEKVVLKLKNARTNLTDQIPKLSTPSTAEQKVRDVFEALSVSSIRIDDVRKALTDAGSNTRSIFGDYSRILRELEVNRVGYDKGKKKIEEVKTKIVEPLEDVINPNSGNFDQAERALAKLSEPLDEDVSKLRNAGGEDRGLLASVDQKRPGHVKNAQELQEKVDRLLERLNSILAAMDEGILEAQVIEQLLEIERRQRDVAGGLDRYYRRKLEELYEFLNDKKK
ncbi:MAG TPA: hypothetical protein VKE98_24895 [Gemmataceae bacterium]|nr:hypothetical protein [Gemmataceae bacterium]